MSLLHDILTSQNGEVVGQIAKQFGLDKNQASTAISNLFPALAGGIKKTAQSSSSMEALLDKLERNKSIQKSINSPDIFAKPEITKTGNEILGQIFGSKEVSRKVAKQTSKSTGIDLGILKKMLPIVASLIFSSMARRGQTSGGGLADIIGAVVGANQPRRGGGLLGGLLGSLLGRGRRRQTSGLESLLDFDGDGSIADDVIDLARKLF